MVFIGRIISADFSIRGAPMVGSDRRPLRYGATISFTLAGFALDVMLSGLLSDAVAKMVFYLLAMVLLATLLCFVVKWFLLSKNNPTLNSLIMFTVPLLLSISFFYLPDLVAFDLNDNPITLLITYIVGYLIIIYGSFIVLLQYHLDRRQNNWNQYLTALFALLCAILSSVIFLIGPFIENDDLVFALKLIASTNSLSTAITVLYVIRDKMGRG